MKKTHAPHGKTPVIAFVLCAGLALASCATSAPPTSDVYFFRGLLLNGNTAGNAYGNTEASAEAAGKAREMFGRALESPNPYVAAAAAAELLRQYFSGYGGFTGETWARIGSAAAGPWQAAFAAADGAGREAALELVLSRAAGNTVLHSMDGWLRRYPAGFSPAESAAVSGRVAASRSRWRDALFFFRIVLDQAPDIFFRHPDLLSDLGRAFQFSPTGTEGVGLFLELEAIAAAGGGVFNGASFDGLVNAGNESLIRFQLLFFAGRIARQRGGDGTDFFRRALPFAEEVAPVQSDATIWYILRTAVDESPDAKIPLLETYVARWHNDASFFDVMDRLSRQLIMAWRWDCMVRVLAVVTERESSITAKFAWIVARAVQEGFVPAERVAATLDLPAGVPADVALIRLAHRTSGRSLYYRLMSANALGVPFLPLPEAAGRTPAAAPNSDATRFLLGFFENGAGEFAMPHIRALENSLTLDELRPVAEALAASGNYLASITLITRYTRRPDFDFAGMTRRDWELWYPTPFAALIEGYAAMVGIEAHLMFALVRAESAFMPAIGSHAGAVGLSQLMPATAEETAARIRRRGGPDFRRELGNGSFGLDLTDPSVNLHIGTYYLGILKNERFGDPLLALMAYNAGTGRVRQWRAEVLRTLGFELPADLFLETVLFPETRNYGRGVTSAMEVYRRLYFDGIHGMVAGN